MRYNSISRIAKCKLVQIIYSNYSARKIFNISVTTGPHSLLIKNVNDVSYIIIGKKKGIHIVRCESEKNREIYAPFRGFFRALSRLVPTCSTLFRFDDIRNLLPAISSSVATCSKPGPRRIGYRTRSTVMRTEEGEKSNVSERFMHLAWHSLAASRMATHCDIAPRSETNDVQPRENNSISPRNRHLNSRQPSLCCCALLIFYRIFRTYHAYTSIEIHLWFIYENLRSSA